MSMQALIQAVDLDSRRVWYVDISHMTEDKERYFLYGIAKGRSRKEAARRAAAKLRKLAAEFDKIAEGGAK